MAGNKNKKRENYFQQNINRLGPNFMDSLPLDRMKLDAVKVFRELARGNVDIDIYGKYFLNEKFLEACISTAETKHNFHLVSAMGVNELLTQNVQGQNIYAVYDFHNNAAHAYYLIAYKLTEFRNIKDMYSLSDLVLNLAKYRYYI